MLENEKIKQNYERYVNACKKYIDNGEQLIDYLGGDLLVAPASTMTSLHNSFPGGLIDHMLKVCGYMVRINGALPKDLQVNENSLMKTGLIAEIGKVNLYKQNENEWSRSNHGKMYVFNDEITAMRVGERSLHYIMTNKLLLTENEMQAILNFEKNDDDKMSKWHTNQLGVILRMATELAIMQEKTEV